MDLQAKQLLQKAREDFERHDFVQALDGFTAVLERHPDYADVQHQAGLCLSFLGQPEAALDAFDRALAVNDGYVEAHLNKAITLNELGRFEEARASFDLAQRHETDTGTRFSVAAANRLAEAHADLGDLYLESGALEEAVREFDRAVELRPTYPDLRTRLALALIRSGDLEEAEKQLDRALEGRPNFVRARATRGLVYYRYGDRERALEEWQKCRAQDPSDPQVRAYLSMMNGEPAPPASAVEEE